MEYRTPKAHWKPFWKSNIHVKFGDVQDKVLVYSWFDLEGDFSQDRWNSLLLQLEDHYTVANFMGTGPFTFKYKDLSYRVYPPLFGSLDYEKSSLDNTEVFNFSTEEVNQIIEDIKESHQSIKKKLLIITNH